MDQDNVESPQCLPNYIFLLIYPLLTA